MAQKNKTRFIDGKAFYLAPGLYELAEELPGPYMPTGVWPAGMRFLVERHVDKIGDQNAYEHFSVRIAGNHKYLVKSYHTEHWNTLIPLLKPVSDDLASFINEGDVHPLFILDQLERSGRITRDDIENAIGACQSLIE